MSIEQFLVQLQTQPESIAFGQTIETINANYDYSPTRFTNGAGPDAVINAVGSNEGSCRIFAFALLQSLSTEATLALFGSFYRDDVLKHPQATDHANIRTFMKYGWAGIHFDGAALSPKQV